MVICYCDETPAGLLTVYANNLSQTELYIMGTSTQKSSNFFGKNDSRKLSNLTVRHIIIRG